MKIVVTTSRNAAVVELDRAASASRGWMSSGATSATAALTCECCDVPVADAPCESCDARDDTLAASASRRRARSNASMVACIAFGNHTRRHQLLASQPDKKRTRCLVGRAWTNKKLQMRCHWRKQCWGVAAVADLSRCVLPRTVLSLNRGWQKKKLSRCRVPLPTYRETITRVIPYDKKP